MALRLMQPVNFGLTILVALITFAIVRVLSSFMVLYGRRMTGLTILTGYLLGALLELLLGGGVVFSLSAADVNMLGGDTEVDGLNQTVSPLFVELGVVGYIIPGLIALWFNRQGVIQTLAALIITSVLVRLILIILIPDLIMAYEAGNVSFSELIGMLLTNSSGTTP
jgi:gamma-polyglutamate biosynthesis protein CapC